ncbi:hypothetical protein Hanom_Chr00s005959g01731631 [Helianthus anomalus]
MMLWGKLGQKTKLVLIEKDEGKFGKLEVIECGEGEEGWYETTVGNFRLHNAATLNVPLPNLGALGDHEAKGVPAAPSLIVVDKQNRKKKKDA